MLKNKKLDIIIRGKTSKLSCPINQTWDGHPKIYLTFDDNKNVTCPYCKTRYQLKN